MRDTRVVQGKAGRLMALSACGQYHFTTVLAEMIAAWAKYCADDLDGHVLSDLRQWWPTASGEDRAEFIRAARRGLLERGYTGPVVDCP